MMNIYALRDRLIDYYMQPFAGPDHKSVMAAVARTVNQEGMNDIYQAPHHFELWQLGEVTDDGHIVEKRELIADCASFVRAGIRTPGQSQGPGTETNPGGQREAIGGANGGTAPHPRPVPKPSLSAPSAAEEVLRGAQGGYPPRDDG